MHNLNFLKLDMHSGCYIGKSWTITHICPVYIKRNSLISISKHIDMISEMHIHLRNSTKEQQLGFKIFYQYGSYNTAEETWYWSNTSCAFRMLNCGIKYWKSNVLMKRMPGVDDELRYFRKSSELFRIHIWFVPLYE